MPGLSTDSFLSLPQLFTQGFLHINLHLAADPGGPAGLVSPQMGSELPKYSETPDWAFLRKATVLMGSKAGIPGSASPRGTVW